MRKLLNVSDNSKWPAVSIIYSQFEEPLSLVGWVRQWPSHQPWWAAHFCFGLYFDLVSGTMGPVRDQPNIPSAVMEY